LAHLSRQALAALADHARDAGVLLALAGSLRAVDVVTVAALGADVVGVRGAACDGGREGRISPARLAALHRALRDAPAPAAPRW
ncbi:MAG: (5-formylfuran-3-yl)methyl phosphate synthase, partial [Gemmatimonadales bacterium]|nr:(5-formylfuran-3-yl)methyl phosphate synthase [Gemmatimonadales bacterium]